MKKRTVLTKQAQEFAETMNNAAKMQFVLIRRKLEEDGRLVSPYDVSQFAKTFKELVGIYYKAFLKASEEPGKPVYCGSIWSGRFKSTLIEGGSYLATCVRYVELNPVRAGMVAQSKGYAYSSANEPKPGEADGLAGCVPDAALLRRVAQVGNGKIFGGYAFVMCAIFGFGDCFAGHPVPRPVFAGALRGVSPLDAYASHGWRKAG